MVAVGWLFLLVGIGLTVLALASVSDARTETAKALNIIAAIAGAVVVLLALFRLVD